MKLAEQNSWPFLVATAFFVFLLLGHAFSLLYRWWGSQTSSNNVFAMIEILVAVLNIGALFNKLLRYLALFFNCLIFFYLVILLIVFRGNEQDHVLYTMIGLSFLANGVFFYEIIFRRPKYALGE